MRDEVNFIAPIGLLIYIPWEHQISGSKKTSLRYSFPVEHLCCVVKGLVRQMSFMKSI